MSLVAAFYATTAKSQDTLDIFAFESGDLALLSSLRSEGPRLFYGVALSDRRTRLNSSADGSATVGLSFGDIDRNVAVRTAVVITSLSDDFADSGYLAARFAKRVNINGVPIEGALSLTDIVGWGQASGNDERVGFSLAVTPIFRTPGDRFIPLRLSAGSRADLLDLNRGQEYFVSATARWNSIFATSVAVVDQRLDIGAGLNFRNLFSRDEAFYFGLTLEDALDTDSFRRVTLRSGISIPIGY